MSNTDLATIDPTCGTTGKPDLCRVRRACVGATTDGINARGMALVHSEA